MSLEGFPYVAASGGSVLILGSMPGQRSLQENQYYAHPRNAFWPIMGVLFGADPEKPYEERLNILTAQNIVLWDVLKSCDRPGSLDSSIDNSSAVINDFTELYRQHASIKNVFCNGRKATDLYQSQVIPNLDQSTQPSCYSLPSTSPAYAAMPFEQKLKQWRTVLDAVTSR